MVIATDSWLSSLVEGASIGGNTGSSPVAVLSDEQAVATIAKATAALASVDLFILHSSGGA